MIEEKIKLASNISINLVKPLSIKNNGKLPPADLMAKIVESRFAKIITHEQVKQILNSYYENN